MYSTQWLRGLKYFDLVMFIAQDIAYEMKAMHGIENQRDTHASLVLRYTLQDVCILCGFCN